MNLTVTDKLTTHTHQLDYKDFKGNFEQITESEL